MYTCNMDIWYKYVSYVYLVCIRVMWILGINTLIMYTWYVYVRYRYLVWIHGICIHDLNTWSMNTWREYVKKCIRDMNIWRMYTWCEYMMNVYPIWLRGIWIWNWCPWDPVIETYMIWESCDIWQTERKEMKRQNMIMIVVHSYDLKELITAYLRHCKFIGSISYRVHRWSNHRVHRWRKSPSL